MWGTYIWVTLPTRGLVGWWSGRRAATSECLFVALRSIAPPTCIICDIGGVGFVAVVAVVAVVATVAVAVVVAAVPPDSPLN